MMDQNELPFCNKTIDRATMKRLISKLVICFGIASTTNVLDQVKVLGFQQATKASVSLGIDDLLAVPTRGWLHYRCGSLHAVEKLRQSIETWYATSECLKREMNPSFKIIDPLNPVHMMSFSGARGTISQVHQLLGMRGLMSDPRGQVIDLPIRKNFREGLSLTEYIISCYGARKGVVDTAVRTSDAGYLTRRLVEVVQHIAVRKRDCGTAKSITFLNISEQKRIFVRTISYQRLIGRVLADHVYWDVRCVATRNQDISDRLANNLVASLQPIHLRSPLTCKSIYWVCQFCYGWSLAHCDLVEVGEAVGIIAGQSIGEPGTQLTLRTFHTGGVFTGDIAEYVRIPFNGVIKFDENLVNPMRTRHGHPAWICQTDLPILINSADNIYDSVIPTQSLLLIQNGQYIESQQIIAEVRAKESPKERIQKPIYPNLKGEIHWSKFVWHVRNSICDTDRFVREASHIWILSGSFGDFDKKSFFYKDQDRVSITPSVIKQKHDYLKKIVKSKFVSHHYRNFQRGIREFGIDPKCFLNWSKCPKSNYIIPNIKLERAESGRSVLLLLEQQKNIINESYFRTIDVQLNNILDENHTFATYENFRYRTDVSGFIKYGKMKIEPIASKKICFGGKKKICTQITHNIIAKTTGFLRIEKTKTYVTTIRIIPGDLYSSDKQINIFKRGPTLLAPDSRILDDIKAKNWVYLQPLTFSRKKRSVLITPVIEYDVSFDFLVGVPSCPDKPKTQKRVKSDILSFICFKNGEKIEVINHTSIQLVQTSLIINWHTYLQETFASKRNYLSLVSINSMMYPPTRKNIGLNNKCFQNFIHANNLSSIQVNQSSSYSEFVAKYQNIIHRVPESDTSFLILSSFNFFRICNGSIVASNELDYEKEKKYILSIKNKKNEFIDSEFEYFSKPNVEEGLTKARKTFKPDQRETERVGLVGTLWTTPTLVNPHQSSFLLREKTLCNIESFVKCSTGKSEHNYYLIDENNSLWKCHKNSFLDKLFSKQSIYSPRKIFHREFRSINLGILISKHRYLEKNHVCFKSGQIIAIRENYSLLRTVKTLLATRGANPHKISGDIIEEGETLMTLPYDRLKSGDITQGLPKVEQLLESRSIASIPTGIDHIFEKCHFVGAKRSMGHCQLVLIDQIRRVYESQGVQISDKHLEIILSQAERMNRVLKKSIFYEPIVLGMTKASLSTTSFLAEASFQETTRVLAKAALCGRIDWLRGLKENVVLGDLVPIGTGSLEIVCQLIADTKNSEWEIKRNMSGYHKTKVLISSVEIQKELHRSLSCLPPEMW
ncbi:hypothetical protein KP509_02G016600 [Ceratopteris richardii]|uniref:DNA-directed RNA polymerase n=1 Tax=Ceratopteris richardii TaxID=49495 RepID=A0A8T2VF09_CERRI|nr:hypothetical protein KP509_02G016600 [Ceratopteris richardii]